MMTSLHNEHTHSLVHLICHTVLGDAEDKVITETAQAFSSWGSSSSGETDLVPRQDDPGWAEQDWGAQEGETGEKSHTHRENVTMYTQLPTSQIQNLQDFDTRGTGYKRKNRQIRLHENLKNFVYQKTVPTE